IRRDHLFLRGTKMYRVCLSLLVALGLVTSGWMCGKTVAQEKEKKPRDPDVIYVPTPQPVVDKMLQLAEIKKSDLVYDLGCGDGRIVVTAAKKFGCKAVGFDIDPKRIKESNENVKKNKVGELV